MDQYFSRTQLLFGREAMNRLFQSRVAIFGIGGVGGHAAEALARSGVGRLDLIDKDVVAPTNINRQIVATTKTLGRQKVSVMKERILEINPDAQVNVFPVFFLPENANLFDFTQYDYVIDAIDSLDNKVSLIRRACSSGAVLFSSMGAALKMDPAKISVAEFWKVRGCPLGAALRRKFKKSKLFPSKKFKCVYSEELLQNVGTCGDCGTEECVCKKNTSGNDADWHASKVHTNGTVAHITAIFGFTLAGLVIEDIRNKSFGDLGD